MWTTKTVKNPKPINRAKLLNQVNMKRRGKEISNKGHTECVLRKTSFHFRSWELVFV